MELIDKDITRAGKYNKVFFKRVYIEQCAAFYMYEYCS